MFAFLKSVVLGVIFSAVISAVVGPAGGTGDMINVRNFVIEGFGFYWSWMLFVGGALLAFVIFTMME